MNSWLRNIQHTFTDFKQKQGWHLFLSSLVTKALNFVLVLIAVRLVSEEAFGAYSYAQSVLAFLIPLAGLGLHHSMTRFGALQPSYTKTQQLYVKTLKRGFLINIIIVALLIICVPFITKNVPESFWLVIILAFSLFGNFCMELLKALMRVYGSNKAFARIEMYFAIVLLILAVVGIIFYGVVGLAFAYAFASLLVSLFWKSKIQQFSVATQGRAISFPDKYMSYGFYAGIGGVASALMYQVDLLTIGNLISDESQLAIYKVATHLPYSLIFVALMVVHAQYVHLSKNYENKQALLSFLKHYFSVFIPLGIVLYVVVYFTCPYLIKWFYGDNYITAVEPLRILFLGLLAIYWLRVPFGNLLAAVGKTAWNASIAGVMIVANVGLNIWLVSRFGIVGAAWATTILLFLSGFLAMGAFFVYLIKTDV